MDIKKECKYCFNCKYYKIYYKNVNGGLRIVGCGECRNPKGKLFKTVDANDTCEKWEEEVKEGDIKNLRDEIIDIVFRLNAIQKELNKFI